MKKLFAKKDKEIEKQMKMEEEKQSKTMRILILGPRNCGKTTLVKQMKRLHKHYDDKEYTAKTPLIKNSVIGYMQTLCHQSALLRETHNECTMDGKVEPLANEIQQLQPPFELTAEIGGKIKALWSDNGIQQTFHKRHLFSIKNNADYFLNKMDEIASDTYVSSFSDYLRIHSSATGLNQNHITMDIENYGEHFFDVTDIGGQKSEIKRWIKHVAEDIHAVMYVVSLSDYEYDAKADSEEKVNPLIEAIHLFKTVTVSDKKRFFNNKSVYVLFNKFGEFQEKIKETPITVAFDDFPDKLNANDENDVVKFVGSKFFDILENEAVELDEPLHILRTDGLDTSNVKKKFTEIGVNLINKVLMK